MEEFSYAKFSNAAMNCVVASSVLAFADNAVAADPQHLRRALESDPDAALWRKWNAAGAETKSVFGPELRQVMQRALDLADGSVEPADLAAALDA